MNVLLDLEEYVDTCFDEISEYFDRRIAKEGGKATVNMGDMLQVRPCSYGDGPFVLTLSACSSSRWMLSARSRSDALSASAKPATTRSSTYQ